MESPSGLVPKNSLAAPKQTIFTLLDIRQYRLVPEAQNTIIVLCK
jgi:hypothetical protein